MFDPFADEPQNTSVSAPAPTPVQNPWEDSPTVTTAQPADQATTDQNYVTVILKGGAGYGAPSVSIRGANIPDVLAQMQQYGRALQELMQITSKAAAFFSAQVDAPDSPRPSAPQQRQPRPGQPEQARQHPDGETQYCAHGERIYKTGISKKNGKPYEAFFCRSSVCSPIFV